MRPDPTAGVALTLALAAGCAVPLAAQRRPAAFETITPSVSLARNLNRNAFHEQWSPGTGIVLAAELPFYAGQVEAGVEQLGYESRSAGVPGFRGRWFFVGWGLELAPVAPLRLKPGVRLGSYAMRFDEASLPEGRRHESEVAFELVSRAALRLGARWSVSVSGHYRLVDTDPVIRHVNLAAGLSRTFDSPRWLRDFLD
jgi:hypothetical protein